MANGVMTIDHFTDRELDSTCRGRVFQSCMRSDLCIYGIAWLFKRSFGRLVVGSVGTLIGCLVGCIVGRLLGSLVLWPA